MAKFESSVRWLLVAAGLFLSAPASADDLAPGLKFDGPYKVVGGKNFLTDYAPLNADGTINAVIEIPTGTIAKWEVTKPDGVLAWEFKKGKPRRVKYLGYPGNYGMIPQTLLAKGDGGDGDPLDVIVLGEAVPRGAVVKARVLGVLKLLDGGEVDDKIVAVLDTSAMAKSRSPEDLRRQFPGVLEIVKTWFENYKGPGEITSSGYASADEAMDVVRKAQASFNN